MKRILTLLLLIGASLQLHAQPQVVDTNRFPFEPDLSVDANIPSPKSFLGYELGENFTGYAHIVAYYKKLAEPSSRVVYPESGTTYEGRPLINLVISSEENINNIAQIQATHLTLLDASAAQAQTVIDNQPVFSSFSYNIHGNEASSSEAAMQVAYRMAAANDAETDSRGHRP